MTELRCGTCGELEPNKWISVKNRLPTFEKECLIYIKGKSASQDLKGQIVIAQLFKNGEWFVNDDWDNKLVSKFTTHWMPLPQPPKVSE